MQAWSWGAAGFSSRGSPASQSADPWIASSLEEQVRENEPHWQSLAETLPHLVWTATADGTVDYISAQATAYMGRAERDLLGMGWIDAFHPDDRDRTNASWLAAIREQRPHEVQHRIRRADGVYRWFTSRGVPARDVAGRVFKWFGTSTDITELKELQEDLRRNKELMELAVRGSKVGIFDFDMPDGNIDNSAQTMINVWERLGYDMSEWPGEFLPGAVLAIHPDDLQLVLNGIQAYLSGPNEHFELEYRVLHKSDAVLWHIARGRAIRAPDGKPIRFVGCFFDTTDMKQAEERLRESEQRWRPWPRCCRSTCGRADRTAWSSTSALKPCATRSCLRANFWAWVGGSYCTQMIWNTRPRLGWSVSRTRAASR